MAQLAGPIVVTKDFACTVAIQLCTFMSIQIQKNERKDKAIDEVLPLRLLRLSRS